MDIDPKIQKWCAWCGPALVVLMLTGMSLAHMIPWGSQPHPSKSADEIASFYRSHLTSIRIGVILCILSQALYIPYGILIALHTRRIERGFPIISTIQGATVAAATALGAPFGIFWALAAFRADDPSASAETIRMFNDAGWIFFMIPLPVFTLWFLLIAVLVCSKNNDESVFPRWVGWLNWLEVFGLLPVYFVVFFKDGALGWNGAVALYLPLVEFCVWFLIMTGILLRAANRAEPLAATGGQRRDELDAPFIPVRA
jgi:hypothetical protein